MLLGGGVWVEGLGVVVAGGGVADAGGGVAVLGLLIAPGVVALPGVLLSGGQLAFALAFAVSATVGLALEVAIAWLRSLPGLVLSTQGLISGTEPGVDEGPGVAVGAFPGTVPAAPGVPDWAVFVPSLPGWLPDGEAAGELEVPAAPAPLVVWATARPASTKVKVTIRSSFRIRFFLRENCCLPGLRS